MRATGTADHNHNQKWTSAPATLAGAGAGLVSSVATCPLDVIKTKLQAQKAARGGANYLGIVGTVKDIWRRNGIRGMYRGLGPTILGYLPTWAIYFSLYDGIKKHLRENRRLESQRNMRDSMTLHVLAAMSAGVTGSIVTNPLWVIKTRFMTQPPNEPRYRHTLDALITIYRREGIGAFYRGLVPSLLGVSHVAVQFPLYEELKSFFADSQHIPVSGLHSGPILLASSISKMVASLITYPHEVIRTRLQIENLSRSQHRHSLTEPDYLRRPSSSPLSSIPPVSPSSRPRQPHMNSVSIIRTTRLVIKENGWRALYRGLSINLMRTVPNSGITLLTYEVLMRQLT